MCSTYQLRQRRYARADSITQMVTELLDMDWNVRHEMYEMLLVNNPKVARLIARRMTSAELLYGSQAMPIADGQTTLDQFGFRAIRIPRDPQRTLFECGCNRVRRV